MQRLTTMAAALALCAGSAAAAKGATGGSDAQPALDRIKTLVGTWEGPTGAPNGPTGSVRYVLTGGGHTVVETLFPGTDHEMMTLYHLDGDKLLASHYCASGNAPLMKLEKSTAQELESLAGRRSTVPSQGPADPWRDAGQDLKGRPRRTPARRA